MSTGQTRTVLRDAEAVRQFRCPGCGIWGDVDLEQVCGTVSIECPVCGFHEAVDLSAEPFPLLERR